MTDGRITIHVGTAKAVFPNHTAFYNFILAHAWKRKDGTVVIGHGTSTWFNYDELNAEDVAKIPAYILDGIHRLKLRRY